MNRLPRCWHCHDVIGVYERMVVLSDGRARTTSRAAEQGTDAETVECYHHDCYTLAHGTEPPP